MDAASSSTVSGQLSDYARPQGFRFFPPHRERNQENQFGIDIPWRGWTLSGPKVGGERTCSLTFFASPSDPILLDRDRTRLAATLVILP